MHRSPAEVTQLLTAWSQGNEAAGNELMPVVYKQLHRLAHRYLRRERPDHTLEATALVHEAYLQLVDQRNVQWQSRAHFFGIAAQLMRRILVEYARRRSAAKRGSGEPKLSLGEHAGWSAERNVELVALDEALTRLATIDPQQSRLVELRFFGELTVEETAEVLSVSPRTVKREWRIAKAWLRRELDKEELR